MAKINIRRGNEIACIEVNVTKVTGVQEIKQEIFYHFCGLFKDLKMNRPMLERFEFNRIEDEENSCLITELTEEEIKRAVWDCESSKSPGHMVLTLGLSKSFGR